MPPKIRTSPDTIKKYMTQEGSQNSPVSVKQLGAKSKQVDGANKNGQNRQSMCPSSSKHSKEQHQKYSDFEQRNTEDQRTKAQLPTKMADMFGKLEQSLKRDMETRARY